MFRLGVPHIVGIVQVGNQITVSADGRLLTHFTDTQRPYLTGEFGFYCEDAQAQLRPDPTSPPSPTGDVPPRYRPQRLPVQKGTGYRCHFLRALSRARPP